MPYWMRFLESPIKFDKPEGGSGGGGNGDGNGGGSGTQTQTQPPQQQYRHQEPEIPGFLPDAARGGFQAAMMRHGNNGTSLAAELFVDNYNVREQNRQLREKLPGEKDVVLSGNDITAFNAYKELGTPEEIKQKLSAGQQLQEQLAKAEREKQLGAAAEVLGWKSTVLVDRVNASGITVELKEETVDGEKVKVPYAVWKEGAEGNQVQKEQKLDEYATEKWSDFLPALEQAETRQKQGGTQFPATRHVQPPGRKNGQSATKGAATSILGSRYGAKKKD